MFLKLLIWGLSFVAITVAVPVYAEPRGFAIVVGIDDYQSSGSDLANLNYAEADALKIAEYLASQDYEVSLLLGSKGSATKLNIKRVVSEIASKIGQDDKFVFSFSGHGIVEEREGVKIGYLVAEGPVGDASKISAGEIQDIMFALDAARHQLFIFQVVMAAFLGSSRGEAKGCSMTPPFSWSLSFSAERRVTISALEGRTSRFLTRVPQG